MFASSSIANTTGLDTSFGVGGVALVGATVPGHVLGMYLPTALTIQTDGKILIPGFTAGMTSGASPVSTSVPAVGRLNADGSWDTSFGNGGLYALPTTTADPDGGNANQIALLSDNSLIVAGGTLKFPGFAGGGNWESCTLLFKLDSNGVLDASFGNTGSFCFDFAPRPADTTYNMHSAAIQADASDLVYLTSPETNLSIGAIARFTANGTLDTTYGSSGIAVTPDDSFLLNLQVLPSQRVIATNGTATYRFLNSGALDTSYGAAGEYVVNFGSYAPAFSNNLAIDEQGRALFGVYQSRAAESLGAVRVTANGVTDTTFNGEQQQPGAPGFAFVPAGQNGASALAAQPLPDGHIFEVGYFDYSGDQTALLRLNNDASFDLSYGDPTTPGYASLTVGTGDSAFISPRAIATDSRGRIYIAAFFSDNTHSVSCLGIVRLIGDQLFSNDMESPPALICP